MMELYNYSINWINKTYEELKLNLGWRFLYSPKKTLSLNPNIVFMGLNPGGNKYCEPITSVELGNAYRIEKWNSNSTNGLQKEVILLFEKISEQFNGSIVTDELMDNSLTSNFCPFRSPSWESIANKSNIIEFCYNLWANIFSNVKPNLIICIDNKVFKNLNNIFNDLGYKTYKSESILTGWGNIKIEITELENKGEIISIIRLPHLSRYKIISSKKCKLGTDAVIKYIVQKFKWRVNEI